MIRTGKKGFSLRGRLIFAAGVVALMGTASALCGPAVAYRAGAWPIEVSVEPDQAAIMLGEPTWLSFRVRNLSDENLQVMVGGDYRNAIGRPDSFKVRTVDRDGKDVAQPSAGENMGGIVGLRELPAKGTYVFRLFLPHWATFQKTGRYTVTCNKTLRLLKQTTGTDIFRTNTTDVGTQAETVLEIIPRSDLRMAAVIAGFFATMLGRDDDAAQLAAQALAAIDDPQVVPFLCRAVEAKSYSLKFKALGALAKFDSDEALAGLKTGMATTATSFDEGNQSEQLANNIRHAAAVALGRSPNPRARSLLLAQRRDPSPAVRLTVVHLLGAMPPADALPTLREMSEDSDTMVRNEAKRYIELATAGKR